MAGADTTKAIVMSAAGSGAAQAPSANLYALPSVSSGVAMNPPPLAMLPSITAAVSKACESIAPGKHVALVGITTQKDGVASANLALVARVGSSFTVTGWIGRSWGDGKASAGEVGAAVVLQL